MNKQALSERDICTKIINPAIQKAGWDIQTQVPEEYAFTDGRVIVRGNITIRGTKKRADYLLFYKANLPIAVIEAKDNKHNLGDGLQQGIEYAQILDVPFVYSSTYVAFQIIWRLWKSRKARKILYLADRNILIDQTIQNNFAPLKKVMTKIENRTLDSSYEIYMSLYHQLAGEESIEIFREFSSDFFDLIIVDECHRGSARDNSRWRKILEYFDSAIQIGLTATPKEDRDVEALRIA